MLNHGICGSGIQSRQKTPNKLRCAKMGQGQGGDTFSQRVSQRAGVNHKEMIQFQVFDVLRGEQLLGYRGRHEIVHRDDLVTAFRDAAVQLGPWRLPLMVQDYIGALNVVLAGPFLAIGGVNVVALRWLSLLTAALTLTVTWRIAWRLGGPLAASATALLLAVNPAFIFWSRQGVFVTNLTALIFMASLLTGLRWWELRRPRDLAMLALAFLLLQPYFIRGLMAGAIKE